MIGSWFAAPEGDDVHDRAACHASVRRILPVNTANVRKYSTPLPWFSILLILFPITE